MDVSSSKVYLRCRSSGVVIRKPISLTLGVTRSSAGGKRGILLIGIVPILHSREVDNKWFIKRSATTVEVGVRIRIGYDDAIDIRWGLLA